MGFKDQIFNRLFGSRSVNATVEESPAKAPSTPTEPVRQEQISPPTVKRQQLVLPDEHPINRLYSQWEKNGKATSLPPLDLGEYETLSPTDISKDLKRLEKELATQANARLQAITPPKPRDIVSKEGDISKNPVQNEESLPKPPPVSLDALPFVFLSGDRLNAWLMVFAPTGEGKELDKTMLERALAQNALTYGTDFSLLERLPKEPNPYFRLFLIAKGTPPTHGQDGYIEDFFERALQPKFAVDEHDRIDYFNLNLFQNIEKGAVICQAVPPVAGIPGRTVLNEEIPCKEGKQAPLPKGNNTSVSPDGRQLVASLSGRVEFKGQGFHVINVLDINGNVDLSTGNINFMGDVHIHGDVCNGFTVRAMGNIIIDGVVENGEIEAGGDLRVAKGIQGDSNVVIRSRHNLYAKYMENCIVHVRKNLYADYLVNCNVYCDGEVQVRSGRGIIIGGTIRSARKITAQTIGSRSENATAIYLGGQPCADYERSAFQKRIDELGKEIKRIERQPESPAKAKQMNKARLDLSVTQMKLAQFDKDLEKLKKSLEEQGGCRLQCDLAYPGLKLTIGADTLHLTKETSYVNGRLVDGEVRVL